MTLERRCTRVARIYPDPRRRAEVATTLVESNEGRRAPRLADVANVLWHGAAARLRHDASAARPSRWGDWASMVFVFVAITSALPAAATAHALFDPAGGVQVDTVPVYVAFLQGPARWVAGLALLLVGAATAAIWYARVGPARLLTAAATVVTLAAVATGGDEAQALLRSHPEAVVEVVVGTVIVAGVLGTGAVARAGRTWRPRRVTTLLVYYSAFAATAVSIDIGLGVVPAVLVTAAFQPLFVLLLAQHLRALAVRLRPAG